MSSFGSFRRPRSRATDRNLAPRFRLKHTSSHRSMSPSRPHTAAALGSSASSTALGSRKSLRTSAAPGPYSPIVAQAKPQQGSARRGRGRGRGRSGGARGEATLHSLGASASPISAGSPMGARSASRRQLTAHGSRRRLQQLLHGTSDDESEDVAPALPLRTTGSSGRLVHSQSSFLRPRTSGSSLRGAGGSWRKNRAARERRRGREKGRSKGMDLLEYGVGGPDAQSVMVEPQTTSSVLTATKKRAIARANPHRSMTTREVFGFRPN